jgi:plasmid stabilization system protein ParE
MAELILAPEAEAELDDIWLYIARESGSIEIANRVVDSITGRFWLLARYPYSGRQRDRDLGAGLRSLASGDYVSGRNWGRKVERRARLLCRPAVIQA